MAEKKSFWTTLPGILTGIAAVITAFTGLYIVLNSNRQENPPAGGQAALAPPAHEKPLHPAPAEWPMVSEETFSSKPRGWNTGNFPTSDTPRFDLRAVQGVYRWDVEYSKPWHRWVIAPSSSLVDFNVGVDFKMVSFTSETSAGLIFDSTETGRYVFQLSSSRYFALSKTGADNITKRVINWSPAPAHFDPKVWNRMNVVVDAQRIRFYLNSKLLGEFRDPDLTGGKTGISVQMYAKGSAVVDFDNFQLRRKPS